MKKHPFIGTIEVGCVVKDCGRGFTDEIHEPPFEIEPKTAVPFHSPMDDAIAEMRTLIYTLNQVQGQRHQIEAIATIAAQLTVLWVPVDRSKMTREIAVEIAGAASQIYSEIKRKVITNEIKNF